VSRILTTLAILAVSAMIVVAGIGLGVGDLHDHPSQAIIKAAGFHRILGVVTAIFVLLCNSIVVTYFVGTGRWCKEVVETYRLNPELVARSMRLKRKAFPWALCAMLMMLGIVALGGAADPATGRPGTEGWVLYHLAAGLSGVGFVALAFFMEWNYVALNYRLIEEIMAEVHSIRAAKGLDTQTANTV
jgi:hypothetical protein